MEIHDDLANSNEAFQFSDISGPKIYYFKLLQFTTAYCLIVEIRSLGSSLPVSKRLSLGNLQAWSCEINSSFF